ncbi:ethylene-responsive transcription factor ERF017-like [Macadamia integrifolia]|uniref:ethylene-responsive transcription factor ERF017-like n=1 Tax=Macadamia integrifolia TaxID=60698 RepID=UPI001C4EB25F|nr:ethylene-responsive transcription factor ERF017-like [Macadamia integrifolia]
MVKPSASEKEAAERSDSSRYKGVRKRKWGKWVSEIRLPNSRERIWLGSYDTPEKAARAFDAALFCLRGRNAKFNFPNSPPQIPGAESLSHPQIRAAAARFANEKQSRNHQSQPQDPHSLSTSEYASPSSTSDGAAAAESDASIDWSFFDTLPSLELGEGMSDFGRLSEIPDYSTQYFAPPQPSSSTTTATETPTFDVVDEEEDGVDNGSGIHQHRSFLWNF